jgi:hypothetical protein
MKFGNPVQRTYQNIFITVVTLVVTVVDVVGIVRLIQKWEAAL